jgi:MFS family permease
MDSNNPHPSEDAINISVEKEQESFRSNAAKLDISEDIDPRNEVQGTKLVLIHIAICLCTFLVELVSYQASNGVLHMLTNKSQDFNLIATAVSSKFNSTRDIGWYGATFMVALCATQPLAGKIYTLFSKKMTFLVYIFFFELGSLVCALAPSSRALIAGRTIADFGASGIFAGSLTTLTTIIPLHKRAVWTGIMGSTFSIAIIAGPVIGGALT